MPSPASDDAIVRRLDVLLLVVSLLGLTYVTTLFPAEIRIPVAAVTGIVCLLVAVVVLGRGFAPSGGYES
jgi:hypothetical protein